MTMLMARFERVKTEYGQVAHRVPCKSCQRKTDINHPGWGNMPPEMIAKKARQRGWDVDKKGLATCPVCLESQSKMKKEVPVKVTTATTGLPAETVTPLPPRSPTPTDLRRIMREIDDNWDEAKAIYAGSASDQSIADKLNVPRAWVAEERKRAFGDSQRNEMVENMLGQAKILKKDAEAAMQRALDAAAVCETYIGQINLAIKKMEKLT